MSNSPVRYLEPSQIRAFRHEGSVHPRIEVVDEFVVLSAVVKRVFPQSHPRKYISILESKGKEIGILKTLDGVDEHTLEESSMRNWTGATLRREFLGLTASNLRQVCGDLTWPLNEAIPSFSLETGGTMPTKLLRAVGRYLA